MSRRVAVTAACGRMGREILRAVATEPGLTLVAALERPGHEELGEDATLLAGLPRSGVALRADLDAALAGCDVVIDFSVAAAAAAVADAAAGAGAALVVGTTGLDSAALAAHDRAAARVPVVRAPNMSVGVNVILDLVARAARMLGPEFDFELFEMHHRRKVDSPSGTALRMAETVARARGAELSEVVRHGRAGTVGPRPAGEIGLHAARGGDVVGDHIAIFAGPAERIEIVHRAHGREVFARGAVRAALWTAGRAPGLYDMGDVLGQEEE